MAADLPPADPPGAWTFRIAAYNVMAPVPQPIRFNGQTERVRHVPEVVRALDRKYDLDLVVVNELMVPEHVAAVARNLAAYGFVHRTRPLQPRGWLAPLKLRPVSGGVLLFSKHPILREEHVLFGGLCRGADCLANKGAVFARIAKGANVINVVGTHLQNLAPEIALEQGAAIRALLDRLAVPPDEPLVLAGDLNVDFHTQRERLGQLQRALGMRPVLPADLAERPQYTSDPLANQLVGLDLGGEYSTPLFPDGCHDEYFETLSCPCCPQEYLDYLMVSERHLVPRTATTVVETPRVAPFTVDFNLRTQRVIHDVSDHWPIVSTLTFAAPAPFRARPLAEPAPGRGVPIWVAVGALVFALAALAAAARGLSRIFFPR